MLVVADEGLAFQSVSFKVRKSHDCPVRAGIPAGIEVEMRIGMISDIMSCEIPLGYQPLSLNAVYPFSANKKDHFDLSLVQNLENTVVNFLPGQASSAIDLWIVESESDFRLEFRWRARQGYRGGCNLEEVSAIHAHKPSNEWSCCPSSYS